MNVEHKKHGRSLVSMLMFPLVEEFETSFWNFQPFVWCSHESFGEKRAKNDNNRLLPWSEHDFDLLS